MQLSELLCHAATDLRTHAAGHAESFVPMRGHMTAVIAESMNKYNNAVYIGEDVRHGGYYLVRALRGDNSPSRVQATRCSLLGCSPCVLVLVSATSRRRALRPPPSGYGQACQQVP